MEVPARKGHPPTVVDRDEAPSKFRQDKLQQLRPAFSDGVEQGTVTAGNASPITDGGAALVLTSASSSTAARPQGKLVHLARHPPPAIAAAGSSLAVKHMPHPVYGRNCRTLIVSGLGEEEWLL